MPIEELDSLLILLAERKQKLENEEAESLTEILLDFLHRSQLLKQEKMNEVSAPFLFYCSCQLFNVWSRSCQPHKFLFLSLPWT